ncbi:MULTISPECIES: SRPBCC family protein [unclassified Haladaptatus]|uniref:SRPBCC family protein n=1 Tax=unclassified Haladaptatus TaxID=2622732 RepID=UPI00209BC75F|nr:MULTISPECIES: SRPBCC family protein [unclassified Haladaptatus]MCO8245109.1 SRPBCC family protein [Haladaptatus sp. AB643]MCO8253252.1 SRPBCC family protein [Haladaptatus sp. AB618]
MTVRVERTFDLPVPPEDVWGFIAEPEYRAKAISVVSDYDLKDDGKRATWHIELPIPFVNRTVPVETEDVTREEPRYVKFVGKSSAMRVTGEHEIEETEDGSQLHNRFVVEGKVPGIERYFKKHLDDELTNLERTLRNEVGVVS